MSPDYSERVDALLSQAPKLGFAESDFVDLALAAADQAGVGVLDQKRIQDIIRAAVSK